MKAPAARPMTMGDLPWALDVLERRRISLQAFAPRLWRAAQDARARHSEYLAEHLTGELTGAVALRTSQAVLFAAPRGDGALVLDDVALDGGDWDSDGRVLVAAVGRGRPVRMVAPVHDVARTAFAESLGLRLVECWWHLDMAGHEPGPTATPAYGQQVLVEHADVVLVPAPPVYDPQGPLAFVRSFDTEAGLAAAEEGARTAGAVLAVASVAPTDLLREEVLARRGYARHVSFYEGVVGEAVCRSQGS